jgi:hypothetical protein
MVDGLQMSGHRRRDSWFQGWMLKAGWLNREVGWILPGGLNRGVRPVARQDGCRRWGLGCPPDLDFDYLPDGDSFSLPFFLRLFQNWRLSFSWRGALPDRSVINSMGRVWNEVLNRGVGIGIRLVGNSGCGLS